MHLTDLKVNNFRNFSKTELYPSPNVNIFYGDNGTGKTNLLEAIFLLCLGRSQRAAKDIDMVRNKQEAFRIEGHMTDGKAIHEIAVAYLSRSRKQITIDGVRSRISELYDHFNVVAIGPEDSEILSGSPAARRLFMDIYISQYSKKYLECLTKYYRILAQKNAALKEQLEHSSFNNLLVETGSEIMLAREAFLSSLKQPASGYYSKFSSGSHFSFEYKPSGAEHCDEDKRKLKAQFERKLIEMADKEIAMRSSLVGPHRDDIFLEINCLPARTHGSQGEWRSAAIALKLSIYKLLKQMRGASPILLLDEVFAELDDGRSNALINSLAGFDQLFLTTATEPPAQLKNLGKSFEIKNDAVEAIV